MQLENPRLTAVIASLPPDIQAEAARRLARLNRTLALQNKAEAELIDTLRRVLQSPNPQAEQLRQLLKEVTK
jgi:hypothetical protein